MNQANGALEMLIGRNVLVVGAGGAVIREAQPMPISKMHVQQPLVRAVKANAPLSERLKRIVILQVGSKDHDTAIENIRPANIRCGREIFLQC